MSKKKISLICGWAALIFAAIFLLNLIRDAIVYNSTLNSAPFYLWVLVDAILSLLPALGFLAAHLFFKKKS